MDKDLKQALQKQTINFVDNMADLASVLNVLSSELVLTPLQREKIETPASTSAKINELLRSIGTKRNETMKIFYTALRDCSEDALADGLAKELKAIGRLDVITDVSDADGCGGCGSAGGSVSSAGSSGDHRLRIEDDLPNSWTLDAMRIEVMKVTDGGIKEIYSGAKDSVCQAYPMRNEVRGCCLIINNDSYACGDVGCHLQDQNDRSTDHIAMQFLFQAIGFNVVTRLNLTQQGMIDEIQQGIKNVTEDNMECDCFVCVLLSHGSGCHVRDSDGRLLSVVELQAELDSAKCLPLAGKPKIFIIRTCAKGVTSKDVPNLQEKTKDELLKDMAKMSVGDTSSGGDMPDASKVEDNSMSDFFTVSANLPDLMPKTEGFRGTLFIQSLAYAISTYSHKYEISTLMSLVDRLATRKADKDLGQPICEVKQFLTKAFYFFPGLYRQL